MQWPRLLAYITGRVDKELLIALTAGKRYWVVAKTDDEDAPDFAGIWAFSNNGIVAVGGPQANAQPVFFTEENAGGFAFAVKGTIP